jgi:hypothetical protein
LYSSKQNPKKDNNVITYNNDNSNILNSSITTTSNNVISYTNDKILLNSNILNTKINDVKINTDSIIIGSSNRFITNDIYDRDATFTKNLFSSKFS